MKQNIGDYRIDNDKLFGIFRGVVEDRFDPEKLCRCRIRVLGVHDELKDKTDLDGIPTEELPWAQPCYGLFQGSISGNGMWAVPLQGTYVFVFFENGNLMQPRYFLTAPGMPELPPDGSIGFNDPAEEWPDEDWLEEPDTHRYAKRDKLGDTSLLLDKFPNIREGNEIALGGTWDEAPPMYNSEYPYNNVLHTFAGLYIELDDTPGFERFHLYHPSNSYVEIDMEGRMVIRNNLDRWDITMANKMEETVEIHHRLVRAARTSKVLDSEWEEIMVDHYRVIHLNDLQEVHVNREHHIFVDDILQIDSNKDKLILANETMEVDGNRDRKVLGNERVEIQGNRDKKIIGNDTLKIEGNRVKHIVGDESEKTEGKKHDYCESEYKIEAEGELILRSAEKIIIEAPGIEFKGITFLDHCEYTEIASDFTWGGTAIGKCTGAVASDTAVIARSLGSATAPIENDVAAEANEPPEPPDTPAPSAPAAPKVPTPPPGAPGAPAAPEYEYSDMPPEPDECI